MKLQERLPNRVKVGRHSYRVNLDFRNVLDMLGVMAREDLIPDARDYLALRCVMRRPPRGSERCADVLNAISKICFKAPTKPAHGPKMTDFEQDADLIRAAFLQEYHINLWRDQLHWLEFTALLDALPEGSRYADVLGIRARPMPAPTKYNAELRQWLAKAKAECAVRMTDREAENSYQNGLRLMAEGLLMMAKKEVKQDG